ncbi:beta-galactosidase [Planomonospora sp. ID82291]|uniref:beta-galactosidase n=1 Tax=Planomonospora sp. ID82291 TaxID=2738136 RepID=UPI0018C36FEC|nr:beta-galactosidase [Planomonospora sp. ID82291]MBG0818865.1 beta-galactosidase [Planomonospora sp. ID82291]
MPHRWIRRPEPTGLVYGADYNPEQWPQDVWPEDVRLMREAGVTMVSVGVFSWARLQPTAATWDFGWLDRVLDLLHGGGIAVDLATATASPPPWLTHAHPEVLPVDAEGRRLHHGGRQAWCPSSPVYREHALRLVEEMATRYGGHPALVLWHVSNELGCHNARCHCEVSAAAFRGWLRRRHGDLDGLNAAWGTDFWSQVYSDWEEILPPRLAASYVNPTQQLDFARFCSDELRGQLRAERDVLRRLTPDVPVTTNFMIMGGTRDMDYASWAADVDLVANDHYPDAARARPEIELAFSADLTRGVAGGRPWLLMEHATSAVNWQPVNVAKPAGSLRLGSLAHVARGADGACFFQWRASRAGAEKYHSGMVPHAGTRSKVWRDVVALGRDLAALAEVAGSRVVSEVALLFDWESWWAAELDAHPSDRIRYREIALGWYEALWRAGVSADVVPPDADLSGYRLVLAPTLHLTTDETNRRLAGYTAAGGHLLVTYFSGIVDENDHIRLGGYPGAFRDLLGVRVEEFFPLPPGTAVRVRDEDPGPERTGTQWTGAERTGTQWTGAERTGTQWTGPERTGTQWTGTHWTELLETGTATAVARYTDGPLAGVPAVTVNRYGEGRAWYVATQPAPDAAAALLARVRAEAGAGPVAEAAPGLELVRRSGPEADYLFALNHSAEPAWLRAGGTDLLTGTEHDPGGRTAVPPNDLVVLRTRRR